MVFFADALTLDAASRSRNEGYLKVRARSARVGVYDYSGREVDPDNAHGLRDQAVVKVLRDASAVFERASLASFVAKPITDDHPAEAVTRDNWRDHGRGVIMGAVQDGEYVGFDLAFLDGPTIDKVDSGKVELSNGYSSTLEFGDFVAADGTKCQARQTNIRGNHIALVDRGRAGPECRIIADAAPCAAQPQSFLDSLTTQEKPVKNFLLDGLTVDLANAETAVATVTALRDQRDAEKAKVAGLETQVATLTTDKSTLEAKVTTLEQAVKDAKPTPAQLRDAGKALMQTAAKAKSLGVVVTDAMDEAAIKKAVVDKRLGDKAKEWNDAQIAASFDALTIDIKAEDGAVQSLGGSPVNLGDGRTVIASTRAAWLADKQNAHRAQPQA